METSGGRKLHSSSNALQMWMRWGGSILRTYALGDIGLETRFVVQRRSRIVEAACQPRTAKTVSVCMERHFFGVTRVIGFRLAKAA